MSPKPEVRFVPVSVQRLRLACLALGLSVLTFSQSSGLEAADTKLDLSVAPARFLRTAFSMWDPTAAAGQLQNQAYGYLFPMGPFYLLGHLAAMPAWVVQRSWESLLLIAAFLGFVRLTRLLGVPGFWPRVGAGLSYALAPRMIMELGVISSELLPVAALPWVLIPLVEGSRRASPRRAAARSGIALLFASGINAAATLAVLPVPALWLLTRRAGPRRRSLVLWWWLAVVLACLWWALPLLVLGRYSPPFRDWIESSTVTTSVTNLSDSLRGVDHWEAYLGPGVWPAGWILAAAPAAILATFAVAAVGLAGLARPTTPERLFLVSVLVAGLILLTLGHVATIGPPFASGVRDLLDGPLNPFRNVHKFDPVVRFAIAVGIGHAVAALARRVPNTVVAQPSRRPFAVPIRALVAVAVVGIAAVAAAPAFANRIVPQTRTSNDPQWWRQAGRWLGAHADLGRALVVPGAAQPVYLWGAPRDDALQPLATGPWTVRDATPLTQPGYIRLLDSIESALAAGARDPELAALLARSGIRYLVVRNDLDTAESNATALRFVHATIANSPGFAAASTFGPDVNAPFDPNRLVDLGLTRARPAIEVYRNLAWSSEVSLLPATGTLVANGSADQLEQLIASGLSARTAVRFGNGSLPATTTKVLTDGIRRREFGFGGIDSYSATMSAAQADTVQRAAQDYLPSGNPALSTVTYTGISDVRASSAAGPAESGWAAFDSDPKSAWVSRSVSGPVGQWIEAVLPRARSVRSVQIAFADGRSNYPTRLQVSTDAGVVHDDVTPDSNTQPLRLPIGVTRSIRITVEQMSRGTPVGAVALATLAIPGVLPSRSLLVPGESAPDEISFAVTPGARSACLTVSGAAACEPSWAAAGEEDDALDRTFRLTGGGRFTATLTVRSRPGAELNNLLDAGNPVQALSSSDDSGDPRERAGAAVDGNPQTGWVAKAGARLPSIELATEDAHRLSGIRLTPVRNAPVTAPRTVLITAGAVSLRVRVPTDGVINFDRSIRTRTIHVAVLDATLRIDTDSSTGRRRLLPVGIGEIALLGHGVPSAKPHTRIELPCGAGPALLLNGTTVPTTVGASSAALLEGTTVTARPCRDTVSLQPGVNRLRLAVSSAFVPQGVFLRRAGVKAVLNGTPGTIDVQHWGDTSRDVRVRTTSPAFLSVPENANAGWTATLHGRRLTALMLDGWHQGWLLPAGASGVVHVVFGPQRFVDLGLIAGALAIVALVALAMARPRHGGAPDPAGPAQPSSALRISAGLLGLTAIGGVSGALALAALLAIRRYRHRWTDRPWWAQEASATTLAGVLGVAGLAEAIGPAGSDGALAGSDAVQLLCLVAVAVVVGGLLHATTPRPTKSAQQRPLDNVVRRGSDAGCRDAGEREQRQEVSAEHAPTKLVLNKDQ